MMEDANNVLNIADGGLSTINDSLQRARELTVQASSDTLSSSQRAAINTELTQIGQTIDQVSKTTSFNGKNLLDGSQTSFNVPTDGNAQTSTNIAPGLADASTGGLGVSFNVSNSTTAQATLSSIDSALQKIGDQRSFIGASQNGISSAVDNLSSNTENLTASLSRLQSTDIASEFTNLNGAKLQQAGGIQLLRFSQNAARSLSELIA
ncbi:MAG: hypothetical protein K2X66_12695, partial [Cyanobacteria bacterium]|nr:hypothetical protein [Cyanobacteriota bacterium]